MTFRVYLVKCVDGREYVGCTSLILKVRLRCHRQAKTSQLGAEIRRLGIQDFSITLLSEHEDELLAHSAEQIELETRKCWWPIGFNCTRTGKAGAMLVPPFTGKKHTEEWKQKNGERMKGNQWHLGHRHSEETRAKMSAAQKRRYEKK